MQIFTFIGFALILGAVSGTSTTPKPGAKPPTKPSASSVPVPKPAPGCDMSACNKFVNKYYQEISCKPVVQAGVCCPAKYECPASSTRVPTKCHFKGVGYEQNKTLPDALTTNPCLVDCRCSKFVEVVKFQCSQAECKTDIPVGCHAIPVEGKCCPTIKCPPLVVSDNKKGPGTAVATPPRKTDVTCSYDGTTYVEGEQLPVSPLSPCKLCTCQKGFNGKLEGPACKEISCDIELKYGVFIQRGCAPTYYGTKGCCPISWRCPSATDTIVVDKKTPAPAAPVAAKPPATATVAAKPAAVTGDKCTFGKLTMNVGDKLASTNEDEDCKCLFPPHVTCIQKEVAYNLDIIEGQ